MEASNRPLLAALWMIGSITSFSGLAIATRAVQGRHEVFEIVGYRSLISLIMIVILALATGQLRKITAQRLPGHVLRNVVHFSGTCLWVFALSLIPLAQVFALEFTTPIWVILLSPLILGERLTVKKLAIAALGFVGILIVARPDFGQIDPGVLAAASSAIFFALSLIFTKKLTQGEAVIAILFWFAAIQTIFGLSLALRDGMITLPDLTTLPWLILVAAFGLLGHLSLTKALALAPAALVSQIDFLRLPLIAVVGAIFYDEPLTWAVAIGAALILLANWFSLRAQVKK